MRLRSIMLVPLILVMLSSALLPGSPFTSRAAAQTKNETAQLVFLPGKSVGMIPPSGFRPSSKFSGFEFPEAASSILVAEFPPEAYGEMSGGLTDTALASQSITVSSRKPVSINGVDGLVISGTQTFNGQPFDKWIMLLDAKSVTVMISAQGLSGQKLDDASVMTAFESVRIRAPRSLEDQLAELPFSVGTLAGFRIIRTFTGNSVLLTKGPKDTVTDASQPVIIVVRPLAAEYPTNIAPSALSEQLLRSMKTVKISSVGKLSKTTVAGADGHEMTGVATHITSGKPVSVFQWLQLESGKQIRVVAVVSAAQSKAMLSDLRALASGLSVR